MSWINPDLQLQNLINLLNGIGNFVGYFNKWTPSDNNITVTNNETTITSTTNNVSYCYSSISYTNNFSLESTVGNNNTNMVLGISKNLINISLNLAKSLNFKYSRVEASNYYCKLAFEKLLSKLDKSSECLRRGTKGALILPSSISRQLTPAKKGCDLISSASFSDEPSR